MNIKYEPKLILVWLIVMLLTGSIVHYASAQSSQTRWTNPELLSNENSQSSLAYMTADQYGYLHVFWSEIDPIDSRQSIIYSRFDGENWLPPLDIYLGGTDTVITTISPYVDKQGTLHLIWSLSNSGPLLYSKAPAHDAYTAKNWSDPLFVPAFGLFAKLIVDSKGVLHVLYTDFYGEAPGVFYIRSDDQGDSWTSAFQLDPDIPEGLAPFQIEFDKDEEDGLHVLWYYVDPLTTAGDWIRYSYSKDGGETWSIPFTIDKADEDSDELRMSNPEFKVAGNTVHVTWAGDNMLHRENRYSPDAGQSWTQTTRIMGNLVGQALGGGLGSDSINRVHYATQVRYPMGIYHSYWDQNGWSIPSLIYFITGSPEEAIGDRIQAHNVRVAVRNGNQLVVTFTDSPAVQPMGLYEIHRTLNDAPAYDPLPTPSPIPSPTPTLTPEIVTIEPTLALKIPEVPDSQSNATYQPASGIIWGVLVSLAILLGFVIFRLIQRR
jgi:hypothetical protein